MLSVILDIIPFVGIPLPETSIPTLSKVDDVCSIVGSLLYIPPPTVNVPTVYTRPSTVINAPSLNTPPPVPALLVVIVLLATSCDITFL